jgi:hypothetical protein
MIDTTNFLRFDLSASFFRLGAMSLHCDSAQLLEFASSTNPYGLTFAELLALSALAQRVMAQRELAQGASAQGVWALGAVSDRVGGWRRPTGLEKVRRFSSRPTTSMFYRSVKWTSGYGIRFEPVAFSMASIKVLPENGFVR